jgi:hypothetical protein
MDEEQFEQSPEEPTPRLTFFRVLCIATFLGSGWSFISALFCGIFFDSLEPAIQSSPFPMPSEVIAMLPMLLAAGRWFFLTTAVFCGISLWGAIMMWNLRKTGFHIYAISQIFLLIIPMLFIHGSLEMIPQAMLSGIFIFGYASNLRYMH